MYAGCLSANGGEVAIGEDNGNESAEENARHKRRQKSAKSSCGRLGSNKTVEMVSSVLSILFALLIVVTALVLIFLFHDVLCKQLLLHPHCKIFRLLHLRLASVIKLDYRLFSG